MWRRRTKTPKVRGGIGAFLDEGTEIEGSYSCAGTVMLNGRLRGEINAKDTLIIGPRGSVHASVSAGSLIVHGEIVGNVTATERVDLKSGARIIGDIDAPVIVMEEGVLLEGQCHMGKTAPGGSAAAPSWSPGSSPASELSASPPSSAASLSSPLSSPSSGAVAIAR